MTLWKTSKCDMEPGLARGFSTKGSWALKSLKSDQRSVGWHQQSNCLSQSLGRYVVTLIMKEFTLTISGKWNKSKVESVG